VWRHFARNGLSGSELRPITHIYLPFHTHIYIHVEHVDHSYPGAAGGGTLLWYVWYGIMVAMVCIAGGRAETWTLNPGASPEVGKPRA